MLALGVSLSSCSEFTFFFFSFFWQCFDIRHIFQVTRRMLEVWWTLKVQQQSLQKLLVNYRISQFTRLLLKKTSYPQHISQLSTHQPLVKLSSIFLQNLISYDLCQWDRAQESSCQQQGTAFLNELSVQSTILVPFVPWQQKCTTAPCSKLLPKSAGNARKGQFITHRSRL